MGVNFTDIQETAVYCYNMVGEKATELGTFLASEGQSVIQALSPYATAIADKVKNVWVMIQPYMDVAVQFLKSNLGTASMLLGGAIICFTLAQESKNQVMAGLWITAGLASAVASGIFLAGANILIPNFSIIAAKL